MSTGVMIVEDHPVLRYGLRQQLESNQRYRVIGEAGSSEEALRIAKDLNPAVALVDVGLPGMDGIELTRLLSTELPSLAVLIVSMHADQENVARAMRAGARGYVLKDSPLNQIIAAVEAVAAGGTYYSFGIINAVYSEPPQPLSPRELEILQSLIEGRSNKDIARRLKLSVRTIESHREAIRRKLGAERIVDLVREAVKRGLAKL